MSYLDISVPLQTLPSTLSPDLHDVIVDIVAQSPGKFSRQDLINCALVSTTFRRRAQHHILARIVLNFNERADSIRDRLEVCLSSPWSVGSHVREVLVVEAVTEEDWKLCGEFMAQFTSLETLVLVRCRSLSYMATPGMVMRLKTIVELRLCFIDFSTEPFNVMSATPMESLRELDITKIPTNQATDGQLHAPLKLPHNLTKIRFFEVDTSFASQVLEAAVGNKYPLEELLVSPAVPIPLGFPAPKTLTCVHGERADNDPLGTHESTQMLHPHYTPVISGAHRVRIRINMHTDPRVLTKYMATLNLWTTHLHRPLGLKELSISLWTWPDLKLKDMWPYVDDVLEGLADFGLRLVEVRVVIPCSAEAIEEAFPKLKRKGILKMILDEFV
ncbi:hypothetical protein CYLTODRAFT_452594 [Cylindrobasidium torrendii FP15055 ss-10]|uniref:Uncharacterized protein n=1 Tax=Cylindrobasidium torrendii FP15055 ss-10 TaxID=1314674 RepID=A0A0D7BHA9_9AGAR|nr:hypothetical protein CYLTODRAFT_452594 [Cylindrobasidium torrendii FP15055 ss-10]